MTTRTTNAAGEDLRDDVVGGVGVVMVSFGRHGTGSAAAAVTYLLGNATPPGWSAAT